MRATVIRAIETRFDALAELIAEVSPELLSAKGSAPKAKSLEEHYWCLIGARESYTRALAKGEWAGFSCSLTSLDQDSVLSKLQESAEAFSATIQSLQDWNSDREALLLSLLEHEVMHEGQIIRHMYALGQHLPASWKWA